MNQKEVSVGIDVDDVQYHGWWIQWVSATHNFKMLNSENCVMARLGRPGLSDVEKAEVWRRWHEGESLSDIGRALSKHPASIFGVLRLFGGFQPEQRTRRSGSLSQQEREEISRGALQ